MQPDIKAKALAASRAANQARLRRMLLIGDKRFHRFGWVTLDTLAALSRTINPNHHPDPDRDIWAETVAATGFDPIPHTSP